MKGYGRECVLGPLFKLLEAVFELLIPLVVAKLVDVGIRTGSISYSVFMCILMIGLGVVGLLCSVTAQYFAARAAVGFSTRLRQSLMEHILSLSCSQLDSLGSSTLITRLTSDINQVQSGVNLTIRLLLRSPFVVFGAMVMAFMIDTQAGLIFMVLIPLLSAVVFGIMLLTMPMYKRVQFSLDQITSATRQNLTGVRVLRAFRKEANEVSKFSGYADNLTIRQEQAGRVSALLNPVTFVIVNLAIILLINVGAWKVEGGVLTQGLVIALYNYMSQILVELIKLANLIINMTKSAACADRIADILGISPDQSTGPCRDAIRGKVEFCDVSARYADASEPALEHISFLAQPGETVGIIGSTGSGKSTLVNLIPRLYDAQSGSILIDDRPVEDFDGSWIRSQIGIVPQKAQLFRGTLRQNLLWGNKDASDQTLWKALETAQARDVAEGKEGRLDAEVEQGGLNFSGGQRQRLTIARALVRNPRILILDDCTSALDYATDAALRKSIRGIAAPPTVFIVSQRVASVRFADRILVLEDGRLVGQGTHEQLLQENVIYREICESQLSREVISHG